MSFTSLKSNGKEAVKEKYIFFRIIITNTVCQALSKCFKHIENCFRSPRVNYSVES